AGRGEEHLATVAPGGEDLVRRLQLAVVVRGVLRRARVHPPSVQLHAGRVPTQGDDDDVGVVLVDGRGPPRLPRVAARSGILVHVALRRPARVLAEDAAPVAPGAPPREL